MDVFLSSFLIGLVYSSVVSDSIFVACSVAVVVSSCFVSSFSSLCIVVRSLIFLSPVLSCVLFIVVSSLVPCSFPFVVLLSSSLNIVSFVDPPSYCTGGQEEASSLCVPGF